MYTTEKYLIEYEEDYSRDGVHLYMYPRSCHTKRQIDHEKRCFHRDRDVMSIRVEPQKKMDIERLLYVHGFWIKDGYLHYKRDKVKIDEAQYPDPIKLIEDHFNVYLG